MLVVRNLDDGHSSSRNMLMKNKDMIEHINKCAFVGLSYNYRICFNEQTWNIQSSFFDALLAVHLSIFISVINQLDAQNFCFTVSLFHASTCFEHYVLIITSSKLYYTASDIITPIGGRPVLSQSVQF